MDFLIGMEEFVLAFSLIILLVISVMGVWRGAVEWGMFMATELTPWLIKRQSAETIFKNNG